jgi:predicted metal-dependent hydrolase
MKKQEKGYNIIRSDRKTLAIEITKDCTVLVRAPRHLSGRDIDSAVDRHRAWIESHMKKVKAAAEHRTEPDESEIDNYIKRTGEYIPGRVAYFGGLMGLKPSGITITGAVTRFGSCSPKNRLCFSWRLMRYPDEAVDYVVVHELAHIVHKNHGKDFYALIASVMPDYKERKKLLKTPVR